MRSDKTPQGKTIVVLPPKTLTLQQWHGLFKEHSPAARAFLIRRGVNVADVNDLLQEAWIKIFELENKNGIYLSNITGLLIKKSWDLRRDSVRTGRYRPRAQMTNEYPSGSLAVSVQDINESPCPAARIILSSNDEPALAPLNQFTDESGFTLFEGLPVSCDRSFIAHAFSNEIKQDSRSFHLDTKCGSRLEFKIGILPRKYIPYSEMIFDDLSAAEKLAEQRVLLTRLVETADPEMRMLLILKHQGYEVSEIAKKMKITEAQVKRKLIILKKFISNHFNNIVSRPIKPV